MTAACGGGTSAPLPEYNRLIYIAPSMVAAFLNNIPTPWAVALAGAIGALTYEASTFCTVDPPAIPTFTAADTENMLHPEDIANFLPSLGKFKDLVGHYLWYQVCQCTSGTMGSPGTPPAAPSGGATFNPPAIAPITPSGQPCATHTYSVVIPGSPTIVQVDEFALNAATTYMTADAYFTDFTDTSVTQDTNDFFLDASNNLFGGLLVGHTSGGLGGNIHHREVTVSSSWRRYRVRYQGTTGAAPLPVTLVYNEYCGTTPGGGGGSINPCPPDPVVQMLLDNILSLVTLIQRQAVPFANVDGAVHAGLSGSGEISVQGLIGCRVTLTATPSNVGIESGDPLTVWNAGWINWGDAHGFLKREFIATSPFQTFPRAAGQYTRIGYSLSPGVVATVTEIVRES